MFTHIDENGDANMVDVSKKNDSLREAIAQGAIILNKEIINAIIENRNKKGDVLSTSRLAGIQAAKRTSDLILITRLRMCTLLPTYSSRPLSS